MGAHPRMGMNMEKIEVDWEIYQMIEAERKGFHEPRYMALRRLLGLGVPAPAPEPTVQTLGEGVPWTREGVTVPHGTPARMEYNRRSYEGEFLNGRLVVNGQKFETLSAAAKALAVTKEGKKASLDGWHYWKVKLPGEMEWRSLGDMRGSNRIVLDGGDGSPPEF